MGTAALVNLRVGQENHTQGETQKILTTSLDRTQFEKEKQDHKKLLHVDVNLANQAAKVEQTHNNKYACIQLIHITTTHNLLFQLNIILLNMCL